MTQHSVSCFRLLTQAMAWALVLALLNAGNNIAAKMAMMAITTSSSMRVNPKRKFVFANVRFVSKDFITVVKGLTDSYRSKILGLVNCAFAGTGEAEKSQSFGRIV